MGGRQWTWFNCKIVGFLGLILVLCKSVMALDLETKALFISQLSRQLFGKNIRHEEERKDRTNYAVRHLDVQLSESRNRQLYWSSHMSTTILGSDNVTTKSKLTRDQGRCVGVAS